MPSSSRIGRPLALVPDLAAAIARAGVDPTAKPRPLQDALRAAIADRRGYVGWDVDHAGWVVDLLSSGLQGVTIHFFCNCVMHLHKLLKKAAEGAGYEIPEADLAVLNAYHDLRNHYEHVENRLPGHVNAGEVVRETITEDEWRIQSGLDVGDQGRIILKEQHIDVTARGLERIEVVVRTTWDRLKPAALDGARKHFEADPSAIPGPEAVKHDLLVSTGGV